MLRLVKFASVCLVCLAVAAAASSIAYGDEEILVLKVEKPAAVGVIEHAGARFLADLGDAYLVDGDAPVEARLHQAGVNVERVCAALPGDQIFLLEPRNPGDEIVYGPALFKVADGLYITLIQRHQTDDLRLLPFLKTRLEPGAFPRAVGAVARALPSQPITVSAKPRVQNLVASVSLDTLSKYISQLSGREPVVIGGTLDTLRTRYSYAPTFPNAVEYVREKFEDYGIPVELETYSISVFDFYSTYFVSAETGWAVGSDQKVFKTTDGGATWVRQSPNAPNQTFFGVSFVDALTGWLAGSAGTIRHTTDGGASWATQTSGTNAYFREIFMLDSQNGWIVGYGGVIRRTTDGGASWPGVPSGTVNDLNGCHFRSNSRGWACGTGTMLFWNGTSWSPQTVGTIENLLDVYFIDDNIGWTVGGGSTILKTVDGGEHWVAQSAPAGVNPYFRGVWFADSLEGWVVGLGGTIIHTADGGASWQRQETATLFGLRWVHFEDADDGWAVGYGGTILHTGNGGATWVNQRGNLPSPDVRFLDNIVASKTGTTSSEQVMICGHMDSISPDAFNVAPGADDNASGTAAAIEAARVMASTYFKRTIKFCAWSGEEQGLYGSGDYAARARSRGDAINGVLNFDMIGYVDSAPENVDVIANESSAWLADLAIGCATAYVPDLAFIKMINPNASGSDHYMFWHAGYDALFCIEDYNVPYPFYHSTLDTLGNLTMPFCAKVVKMGVATLAELAEIDTTVSVPPVSAGACCVSAYPNPSRAGVTVSFVLGTGREVDVIIYDVQGRTVKVIHRGRLPGGKYYLPWSGEADRGGRVAPGVYFVGISTGAGIASTKILMLR